jgi:DNA-binding transcriptional MerR regulator
MDNTYSIGEFAKRIDRKPSTVRRWEQEGKITPKRLPSGHRYFDDWDVQAIPLGLSISVCQKIERQNRQEIQLAFHQRPLVGSTER